MTKHTEIPDDIREKARAIVYRYPMAERDQLAMVAEALMQERERCAASAKKWLDDGYDPFDPSYSRYLGEGVAAAIRSPQPDTQEGT